jgi:hypothetical protein
MHWLTLMIESSNHQWDCSAFATDLVRALCPFAKVLSYCVISKQFSVNHVWSSKPSEFPAVTIFDFSSMRHTTSAPKRNTRQFQKPNTNLSCYRKN